MEVAAHLGLEGGLMELVESVCEEAVLAVGAEPDFCETFAEFELALGGVLIGRKGLESAGCGHVINNL